MTLQNDLNIFTDYVTGESMEMSEHIFENLKSFSLWFLDVFAVLYL